MLLGILLALAVPLVLPIISLVMAWRMRQRFTQLETLVGIQQRALSELEAVVKRLRTQVAEAPPKPAAPPPVVAPPPKPAAPPPVVAPPPKPAVPPPVAAPPPKPATPPPVVATPPKPIVPPPPPPPPRAKLDWEQFVGVRMFSAIAGVALVLAAVFFLRYSIDHGWLAPPVRVAIGIITGVGLLIACELKAARRYPVTANALDAAAIAILFATFFAAHALWRLIPASVAFALLAMVTTVAVLLSIRRGSLFIAVLGLLGGFATPALLSTGENRPIPLFTYLLLLNIGLAWVAVRTRWTILTLLTLVLTTLYQWSWVLRFLSVNQLSLAMGIFLVFAVAGVTTVIAATRSADAGAVRDVRRAGLFAAVMPLAFAVYLAAVPAYGARPDLLFGFLLLVAAGLLALSIARRDEWPHAIGALVTVLVFSVWLTQSLSRASWTPALAFVCAFIALYALGPLIADRAKRPLQGRSASAIFAAPVLLFVFPVLASAEPAAQLARLFGALFLMLTLIAWRAIATRTMRLYFVAAFFAVAAEAVWSASHLTIDHLRAGLFLYAAFGGFYLGVPLVARRLRQPIEPAWGSGAVLLASLVLLTFVAAGPASLAALWGLGLLLAILNAGVFVESASARLPPIALAGGVLSWFVLAVWWSRAAGAIGVMPSLLVLVLLTLVMLAGHSWAHRSAAGHGDAVDLPFGFRRGTYLALLGHIFLFFVAWDREWSIPPWPLFGALAVMTLAASASSLAVRAGELHAAASVAASVVVFAWAKAAPPDWWPVAIAAAEIVAAYAVCWVFAARRQALDAAAATGAIVALFVTEFTLGDTVSPSVPVWIAAAAHSANLALILALAWRYRWEWAPVAAVVPAWAAADQWRSAHPGAAGWASSLELALSMYLVFSAYPFVLGARSRTSRTPYITAIAGAVFFFFAARAAFAQGGYTAYVGVVPIAEGLVLVALLRQLLRLETPDKRDLGRLALVAGAALAFATVAIPLQLRHQWITIGWALEGAALAWTYRRIPHRGLLYWSVGLLAIVFARLALNPEIFAYEPRGYRVFNWYLYAYVVSAIALLAAGYWLAGTDDRLPLLPRGSALLPPAAVLLLFLLLNIEIADYYATGPEITFRFGVTVAQDLTYTIGWLIFGMLLLSACIYLQNRYGRIAAVALIAITACKAFLYDLGSLGGLYRVGSLIGLAVSLSLVALALQRFVLQESHSR